MSSLRSGHRSLGLCLSIRGRHATGTFLRKVSTELRLLIVHVFEYGTDLLVNVGLVEQLWISVQVPELDLQRIVMFALGAISLLPFHRLLELHVRSVHPSPHFLEVLECVYSLSDFVSVSCPRIYKVLVLVVTINHRGHLVSKEIVRSHITPQERFRVSGKSSVLDDHAAFTLLLSMCRLPHADAARFEGFRRMAAVILRLTLDRASRSLFNAAVKLVKTLPENNFWVLVRGLHLVHREVF